MTYERGGAVPVDLLIGNDVLVQDRVEHLVRHELALSLHVLVRAVAACEVAHARQFYLEVRRAPLILRGRWFCCDTDLVTNRKLPAS